MHGWIFWLIIIIAIIITAWKLNLYEHVVQIATYYDTKTGRGDTIWDKIEIVDTLGSGANGIVYKVKIGDDIYALKREKILPEGVIDGAIAPTYETRFYDFIDTLPDDEQKYFVKRIASRAVKCDYVHVLPDYVKAVNENTEKYKLLSLSQYCAETIMELGGESLMTASLTSEQWRHIAGHVVRAIQIMRSHGYMIGDLHTGNIILREGGPNPKISLIDYSEVRHSTDDDGWSDEYFYMNSDLMNWISKLHNSDQFFIKHLSKVKEFPNTHAMVDYIRQLPVIDGRQPWLTIQQYAIMIDPRIQTTIDKINNGEKVDNIYFSFGFLLMILYPEYDVKYWSKVVGYDIPVEDITPLIPREDILFMLDHYHDLDAIIKHFE
jgi:serine/threonine protein kinase